MMPERLQQLHDLVTSWIGKDDSSVMVEHPFVDDFMEHFGPTVGEIRHLVSQAMAANRELDPTPITEAFAKSLSIEQGNGVGFNDDMRVIHLDVFYFGHAKQLHVIGNDSRGWTLKYADQLICNDCSIGQFWTACRLHGVILKESHDRPRDPEQSATD